MQCHAAETEIGFEAVSRGQIVHPHVRIHLQGPRCRIAQQHIFIPGHILAEGKETIAAPVVFQHRRQIVLHDTGERLARLQIIGRIRSQPHPFPIRTEGELQVVFQIETGSIVFE